MSKRIAGWTVAIVVALAFAWTVWPTPYRYHVAHEFLIREHRITGKTAFFSPNEGWVAPTVAADTESPQTK